MNDQNHLSDLDQQIEAATKALREANERKNELEKARLEKARADQLERQLRLEREKKALEEENERKIASIIEARRLREEAEIKARRDAEAEDRRLAAEADRLRLQQEERAKAEAKLREVQQAAYATELEAKRIEQELQRASQPAPEPDKPVDFSVGSSHPLARLVQGAAAANQGSTGDGVVLQPAYESTLVVPLPAQKKPDLQVATSDLNMVVACWPSQHKPETYELHSLLKEFSATSIIEAVNSLKGSWSHQSQQPNYCLQQVRDRCGHTVAPVVSPPAEQVQEPSVTHNVLLANDTQIVDLEMRMAREHLYGVYATGYDESYAERLTIATAALQAANAKRAKLIELQKERNRLDALERTIKHSAVKAESTGG
jgi:hypothetical protein